MRKLTKEERAKALDLVQLVTQAFTSDVKKEQYRAYKPVLIKNPPMREHRAEKSKSIKNSHLV